MQLKINECTRKNLCVDCDNEKCWFHGKLIADCPKHRCDRPEHLFEDCETCAFLKRFQKDMRKEYERRAEMTTKCCDNCIHYHWYYDYCDKYDCEVDAREVHDCFAERRE
jgi:hypothetical protein